MEEETAINLRYSLISNWTEVLLILLPILFIPVKSDKFYMLFLFSSRVQSYSLSTSYNVKSNSAAVTNILWTWKKEEQGIDEQFDQDWAPSWKPAKGDPARLPL